MEGEEEINLFEMDPRPGMGKGVEQKFVSFDVTRQHCPPSHYPLIILWSLTNSEHVSESEANPKNNPEPNKFPF